jgi:hypothetical protein
MRRRTPVLVFFAAFALLLAACSENENSLDTFGACGGGEAVTVHAATNDSGENVEAVVFFLDSAEMNGTYELSGEGDGLPRAVSGTGDKISAWTQCRGDQTVNDRDGAITLALSGTVVVDTRPSLSLVNPLIIRLTGTDLVFENGDEIDELVVDSVFINECRPVDVAQLKC